MALVGAVSVMKSQTFAFILATTIHHAYTGRNLALRKPSNASSTYNQSFQLYTSSVVDGSPSGVFNDMTCHSVGYGDTNPWWQVDLQDVYRVSRVEIVGRSDCCADRLHDFTIDVYVDDPAVTVSAQPTLCHYYHGVFRPTTQDIMCDSVVAGRFVRLSGKKTPPAGDLLTLCEVSIYEPEKYAAHFRNTNVSLTGLTVVALPLDLLSCVVNCVTDPLCIAVKMVKSCVDLSVCATCLEKIMMRISLSGQMMAVPQSVGRTVTHLPKCLLVNTKSIIWLLATSLLLGVYLVLSPLLLNRPQATGDYHYLSARPTSTSPGAHNHRIQAVTTSVYNICTSLDSDQSTLTQCPESLPLASTSQPMTILCEQAVCSDINFFVKALNTLGSVRPIDFSKQERSQWIRLGPATHELS